MATELLTNSWSPENFFDTTLSNDISASDTDIFLDDIPTGTEGTLVIDPLSADRREIIYFSSKTGTKVVCPANGRGYDNTTATTHTQGTQVIMAPVADWFNSMKTGQVLDSSSIDTALLADASVTPAKLLAGTGTSWAWQSWTPTWTNVSGGTLNYAHYIQIGKTVHFWLKYTFAGAGVSGTISFSPPVTAATGLASYQEIGGASCVISGSVYKLIAVVINTTTIRLFAQLANGTYVSYQDMSSTVPGTWANGSTLQANGTYEAA